MIDRNAAGGANVFARVLLIVGIKCAKLQLLLLIEYGVLHAMSNDGLMGNHKNDIRPRHDESPQTPIVNPDIRIDPFSNPV